MSPTRELIESFTDFEPARVVRNGQSYAETETFIVKELQRYLDQYRRIVRMNQTARLIRDQIDNLIRRYHEYVIQGNYQAHYRQVGLLGKRGNVFEHVIPAKTVRNMLIAQHLTITQALNSPTCLISKEQDIKLRKNKMSKNTPNTWYFWQRYAALDIDIETFDGVAVDLAQWDLERHWEYFDVKTQVA
jgi:hypothetical protein